VRRTGTGRCAVSAGWGRTRPRRRAPEPVASDGRRCCPSSLGAASTDVRTLLPATSSFTCPCNSARSVDLIYSQHVRSCVRSR
jgi:hypothetical protein